MLLYEFLNLIFAPFGIFIMSFQDLTFFVENIVTEHYSLWSCFWTPDFLISFVAHIAFAYGLFYFCFILPFRFIKKWLRVPNSKGKR